MFSRYVVELAREGTGALQNNMDSTTYHVLYMQAGRQAGRYEPQPRSRI
jgi:hypothetical protein